MTIIVDAHQDIAYNWMNYGRDYRRSALETRRLEAHLEKRPNGIATLGLPDAILGRVAISFVTLFAGPYTDPPSSWDNVRYKTPREAYKIALNQLDYYQRLTDETDKVRLIRNQRELDAVLDTWKPGTEIGDHKQGWVLLIENAESVLEPRQFEEWFERGVRIVGPAWSFNRYTGGTGHPGRLTDLGHELLEIMASYKVILDVSHMAEEAYLEAVDLYEGTIIASHSNPRRFRDTDRHLSDDMIRRLAERDGVMGIVLYNKFLSDNWADGMRKALIPYSTPIDAIDYVCQLTGSAAHVGIGTDFDGGFGMESIPEGFDTVTDLLTIEDALLERGYSQADTEAILGGNMLRKLRQALPVG